MMFFVSGIVAMTSTFAMPQQGDGFGAPIRLLIDTDDPNVNGYSEPCIAAGDIDGDAVLDIIMGIQPNGFITYTAAAMDAGSGDGRWTRSSTNAGAGWRSLASPINRLLVPETR